MDTKEMGIEASEREYRIMDSCSGIQRSSSKRGGIRTGDFDAPTAAAREGASFPLSVADRLIWRKGDICSVSNRLDIGGAELVLAITRAK